MEGSQHESAAGTLGALLYADKSRVRAPEEEWVSLVHAMASGDQRALHTLYERTHRLVFTLIMRICRNREAADELTVDVFHGVWRRASAYDPTGGSVVGWIMNQARSRALDRLRFEGRKKRVNPYTAESPAMSAVEDSAEQMTLDERGALLRKALLVLSPEERRAIESAFFLDLTYAEVATRHDQPVGTVKTRIRSGLNKLRQELEIG
ncbi:MAG TPA: sigma-70 family RNA polymerase sigma factor [Steroidobacteraceae bacterium]|jgi:RNA polymerase sigma-70 factor (ECF subfamily)|nr:sigma-70 family RNA polymerase sigma factor [Steroidobacteraceae bacterium]